MTAARKLVGTFFLLLLAASPLAAQKPKNEANSRCLGTNPNAPIRIEVFSDYECPHCRQFYLEVIRPLLSDYGTAGKACVIYYEFPLRGRKYSRQAARYSQAAWRLGPEKWIQVNDALYYYQAQWSVDGQLESVVAKALTPKEMAQVREWVKDPKLDAGIDRDLALGTAREIRSTPTYFITANGKTEKVTGAVQYAILRRYLDNLLRR